MEQETREKLLRQCRYYKGERRCPFESAQHALFWRVEQMYVDAFSVQGSRFETLVTEAMKTYLHYGLQNFEASDGVPKAIKALILNRHLKYMEREDEETINSFKQFYKQQYAGKAKSSCLCSFQTSACSSFRCFRGLSLQALQLHGCWISSHLSTYIYYSNIKFGNMAKTDDYRFRISQDELVTLYNNAEARKKAHAELTAKHQEVIGKCVHFDSEKEALQHAIKTIKAKHTDCQIWAQIEKKGDIIRIKNWWIVTDDWKVKQAADFLGLALMYDGIRMQKIISSNVSVDDVVAYY